MQKLSRKNFEKKVVENYYSDCRNRFKAWHELKTKWTGIGWNEYGCVQVDTNSEKWKSFVHVYSTFFSCYVYSFMYWYISILCLGS